jgi:hypothetical protein
MKRQSERPRFRKWFLLSIPAFFLMAGAPAFAGGDFGVSFGINLGPGYYSSFGGAYPSYYGSYWWNGSPGWYRPHYGPRSFVERRHVPGAYYRYPRHYGNWYRYRDRHGWGDWRDRGWDRRGRW